MLQIIQQTRSRNLYYSTILIIGLLGTVNLIINYSAMTSTLTDRSWWQVPLAFIFVFLLAFVVQSGYVIALSLVCYFTCAAMGTGYEIKKFIRLSAKALVVTPWFTLTDLFGFLVFGKKLIDYGVIGLLSYVPVYFCVAYLVYRFIPLYFSVDQKKRKIVSIVSGLAMILLSYAN